MSAADEPLIAARRVSLAFGREVVLGDVTLEVRRGTATTIVGPSGSGKTSLLSLLSLLLTPTSGVIEMGGVDVASLADAEHARLRNTFLGPIFQTPHLVGSLTVLDNVLVPALLSGRARAARPVALAWLDRLGLGERRNHLPHMLSVGQRRRVAIARALVLRPCVILADEPTNDLDATRASEVADFLLALPREGFALVMVTHDPALAARADHCLGLRAGRLEPLTDSQVFSRMSSSP